MYQFMNLPSVSDNAEIEGIDQGHCFRIVANDGVHKATICEVGRATDMQTATDIADAIRFARDAGYKQAMADLRRFIGCE